VTSVRDIQHASTHLVATNVHVALDSGSITLNVSVSCQFYFVRNLNYHNFAPIGL